MSILILILRSRGKSREWRAEIMGRPGKYSRKSIVSRIGIRTRIERMFLMRRTKIDIILILYLIPKIQ